MIENDTFNKEIDGGIEKSKLLEMILAKKTFGIIGWGLCAFIFVAFVGKEFLALIVASIFDSKVLHETNIITYLLSFIPMYGFGLPLMLYIIKKLPKYEIEKKPIGIFTLIKYFFISLTVMYLGNIIGTLLSTLIGVIVGKTANNGIADLITESNVAINIVFVVIFAPIVEEFVFRKTLIDRTVKFGERNAAFLSALLFGVFHANLFQFFYAFGLGLIFAFIYIKSGKLKYTVIFHMIINFMGSIAAVQMAKGLSEEVVTKLRSTDIELVKQAMTPGVTIAMLYGLFLIIAFVAGFIFLILERKKMKLDVNGAPFSRTEEKGLTYGNYGMAFFIAICIALTVWSIISQLK